ncbi:uncharacterized protein [Typha latifolia]|uniref:uncharacterized protein isoform X1 n=1 Tax=Typha latifolia TaxID=4733 RepID=UPI003C2EC90C
MMPPSPSLRYSPARERVEESIHKRGRSFESVLHRKAKDDDLSLFTDIKNHERDSFLLQTSDDIDESISQLRHSSDFKLSITIPPRGESSDLLHAEGDKDDYEWLLTPPDTPLFPSLDDELQSISQPRRGRPQSHSLSRSSTIEKTPRTSRSSASPHRRSISPRSSSSGIQSRTRPSSASRSSPPPVLRLPTPSRRPISPAKPTTPTSRSSTPRRMSTGSTSQAFSSGKRGTSPAKANRGTSASPKLPGWQPNLPGFPLDAPPNLLTDRAASRARGLSPASRVGMDSTSKFRRQSVSPTPSRRASSSHSNERDRFSSYSKTSEASSTEDDMDFMHSVPVGFSRNPPARKHAVITNSRTAALSNKQSRNSFASSVPKRSFDSALLLMDHKKAPHNMFRPLLSSVPAATLSVRNANNIYRPVYSRNSSLTTSSNASSEPGVTVSPYMETEHDLNAYGWEKAEGSDIQEEISIFDKVDKINEDTGHDEGAIMLQSDTEKFDENMTNKIEDVQSTKGKFREETVTTATSCPSCAACSICGKHFHNPEVDEVTDICRECTEKDLVHHTEIGTLLREDEAVQSEISNVNGRFCDEVHLSSITKLSEKDHIEVFLGHHGRNDKLQLDCLPKVGSSGNIMDMSEKDLFDAQIGSETGDVISQYHLDGEPDSHNMVIDSRLETGAKCQQEEPTAHPGLKVDNPEGKGISVLLQRSTSSKWPIVQGRAFSASNILCSDPSYARDYTSAMKRSIGRDSSSAASSVDLGSSNKMEALKHHQLSRRRIEFDKSSCQSRGSVSDMSISSSSAAIYPKSDISEEFDCLSIDNLVVEDHTACRIATGPLQNTKMSYQDEEVGVIPHSSITEECHMLKTVCEDEASDATSCRRSFGILEQPSDQNISEDPQTKHEPSQVSSNADDLHESCVFTSSQDIMLSSVEPNVAKHPDHLTEELVVIVDGQRNMQRSFTLEEATDTVLFCSSIINNLAYKAATIAMEKEVSVPEAPHPRITILGKSKKENLHRVSNEHGLRSRMVKRKRLEADTNTPSIELGENIESSAPPPSIDEIPKTVDSLKPPKMETKCNCTIM